MRGIHKCRIFKRARSDAQIESGLKLMMHFPELLPDENLYSLTARFARVNGFSNHLKASSFFLGDTQSTSIAGCKVNIEHLCEVGCGSYGSPNDLRNSLTNITLLGQLGMGVMKGGRSGGVPSAAKGVNSELITLVMGESPRWRICHQCSARDIQHFGTAYWHRVHQLPTCIYCPEHGSRLLEKSLPRKCLHEYLWLPDESPDMPTSDSSVDTQIPDKIWIAISRLGRDALDDHSDPHPPHVIRAVFLAAFRQQGFLTASNKLRVNVYSDGFKEAFHGGKTMEKLLKPLSLSDPKYLLRGFTDNRLGNPMLRLLLINWSFGSWQSFKDHCLWESVMDTGISTYGSERTSSEEFKHMGELSHTRILNLRYRQICLDFKKTNPEATRLTFLKSAYRAFRWLLHHDRHWLDEQFPLAIPVGRQSDMFE